MSNYDDYLTADDKPFVENINDALLLSNVFDLTVPISVPQMFSNSIWVNSTGPRKCGVSILTLKEALPSGVSISTVDGKSVLTGTGTVKLGFYPNFNSFGSIKSIDWTNSGTVNINLKTVSGTTISSNISKGEIQNSSQDLRTLQEIVIEIVLNNSTLKSLDVVMENKQQNRYGAEVGITDVTGLDDRLDAIESKDTQQDSRLTAIEGIGASFYKYEIWCSKYNITIDDDVTVYVRVFNQQHQRVSGKSISIMKNDTVISSATTDANGEASWTINCDTWGLITFAVEEESTQIFVDGWRKIGVMGSGETISLYRNKTHAKLQFNGHSYTVPATWGSMGSSLADLIAQVRPSRAFAVYNHDASVIFQIQNDGTINIKSASGNASSKSLIAQIEWAIRDNDL